MTEGVDDLVQRGLAGGSVGVAVGGDDALVDAPGGLDLDVVLVGEDGGEPVVLSVGEQLCPGAQDPADAVERVPGTSVVPAGFLLDSLPAPFRASPASATTWKGSITATAVGRASAAADL